MTDITQYTPLWGAWQVDSLIGEGSFGKVYKVRRDEFGKTYYSAVKLITVPQNEADLRQIRGEGMDDASLRSYFHAFVADIIQEIDLMSEFRGNSNIVSFEDHKVIEKEGQIGWDILIRMELLTSLTDHVTDKPLSQDEIIKLGIHICRALELCAAHNTIHRDIKPDNIFISRYGDYKLGDFGIARQIERTSSGLSKKGTYTYMAPEVFRGYEYGQSVDMYSLGIVMYRFLNQNRTPFLPDFPTAITPRDRDNALQRRMNGEAVPPIVGVDPVLNDIVLKACAYDRGERFTSPTEMRKSLERIANEEIYTPGAAPVKAPEPVPIVEASRTDDVTSATEGVFADMPVADDYEATSRTEGVFDDVVLVGVDEPSDIGVKNDDEFVVPKWLKIAALIGGFVFLVVSFIATISVWSRWRDIISLSYLLLLLTFAVCLMGALTNYRRKTLNNVILLNAALVVNFIIFRFGSTIFIDKLICFGLASAILIVLASKHESRRWNVTRNVLWVVFAIAGIFYIVYRFLVGFFGSLVLPNFLFGVVAMPLIACFLQSKKKLLMRYGVALTMLLIVCSLIMPIYATWIRGWTFGLIIFSCMSLAILLIPLHAIACLHPKAYIAAFRNGSAKLTIGLVLVFTIAFSSIVAFGVPAIENYLWNTRWATAYNTSWDNDYDQYSSYEDLPTAIPTTQPQTPTPLPTPSASSPTPSPIPDAQEKTSQGIEADPIEVDLTFRNISTQNLYGLVANGWPPLNVTHLNLAGNSITSLSPLVYLTNLIDLDVGWNQLSDITELRYMIGLTVLNISSNQIDDFSPLRYLSSLEHLSIIDSSISDISFLQGLTNLTSIYAWGNQIRDLSPLQTLTNLETIIIWGNQIDDLSPLQALTNLSALSISNNQITDLTPLQSLTNLEWLVLSGNPLTQSQVDNLRLALPNTEILFD